MRRAMAVLLASAMLAGCPSTMRNRPADATAEGAADVGDEGAAGDGDVADADVDAPEVQMTIEFGSVALHGESDGGVRMRASVTWHHVPRRY